MKTMILRVSVLAAALAAGLAARAQSPADTARQGAAKQEQIQGSSQKLAAELDAMIDEYQRNGLNGDEIKNLKRLKGILSRISDKDMDKIISLLRSAAEPTDPKSTLTALAGAYSQQKGVMVQLQQLLSAYAVDQEAAELAENVRALADRQAANLQAGIETAQWSLAGAKPAEGAVDASLQAQAAEQKAIAEEAKMLQAKLEAFSKKTNNKEVAERFKKGLEDMAKVAPALDSAADSLAQKRLFEAVGNEKAARDQMRQLARSITPQRENSEMFREASETLNKLIAQQKAILETTKNTQVKPIEQWIAEEVKKKNWGSQFQKKPELAYLTTLPPDKLLKEEHIKKMYNSYLGMAKEPLSGLEDRQGDIANQTDSLSQDLDKKAKPAADLLRNAIPPMQNARSALKTKESDTAAKGEEDALASMEKAKESLAQMLAAAQKAEALAGDKAAELRELQKQAQDLAAQQAALAKATGAPKTPDQAAALAQQQAALQQQAAQLQQQTAANSPAASASMAQAANNMKQATDAMKAPAQTPQAQAQQQQAAQNLAKASQQLDQQINQLNQAQQNLDAAEKAMKDLASIIAAQQKLQLDTAQAAPAQEKQKDAIRALAPRQQGIQSDTEALKKTVTDPASLAPMANAAKHMGNAQGSLEKSDAKLAEPEEKKALADLFSIKKALEAQANEAQKQLGQQQQQNGEAAAQTAEAVAQAQAQLEQAAQQMQEGGAPQEAAKPLAQAAQKTAEAAAQATGMPPEANQAMQDAANAAAQAASDAANGKKPDAQANAQKAKDALAQAANALAQAQAGIAGAKPQPPSGTPSNMPPTPGTPSQGDDKGSQGDGGNPQAGGQKTAAKGKFLGLPKRDREAIQQAQSEKYPQQYAAKVEQYLKNLSDESSRN